MDDGPGNVNRKRSYDASRRRQRANRGRARVVEEAERLFLGEGYAQTTIASIAAAAGVSPDTVYKSFGGKAGLVRAIRTHALQGHGPIPAEERSDDLHRRLTDPRKIIQAWGELTAEIAPRVAPILLLIDVAAANDVEVKALLHEMDDDRLRRMTDNARQLQDAGHLRAGITLRLAADILWTYSSPELYELLVLRRGWTSRQYGTFVAEAMIQALL